MVKVPLVGATRPFSVDTAAASVRFASPWFHMAAQVGEIKWKPTLRQWTICYTLFSVHLFFFCFVPLVLTLIWYMHLLFEKHTLIWQPTVTSLDVCTAMFNVAEFVGIIVLSNCLIYWEKYKYYVFGHYPSSCLYLKTVLFIFQNTTFRRLDCVSVFSWAQSIELVSETLCFEN
jgi:hypothetical protein